MRYAVEIARPDIDSPGGRLWRRSNDLLADDEPTFPTPEEAAEHGAALGLGEFRVVLVDDDDGRADPPSG